LILRNAYAADGSATFVHHVRLSVVVKCCSDGFQWSTRSLAWCFNQYDKLHTSIAM